MPMNAMRRLVGGRAWSQFRTRPSHSAAPLSEHRGAQSAITVVIVAYNDAPSLDQCLRSLEHYEKTDALAEVIVVDNSTTPDVKAIVGARHPGVRYVDNPNLGFG